MRRRDFIKVVAGSTITWPLAAWEQHSERIRRIGVLLPARENYNEAVELSRRQARGLN